MSFILDALKRADQERRQEPLTVTFDSSSDLPEEPPAQRSLGLLLGAVILLMVLVLAGYFGFQTWQTPQSTPSDTAVAISQSSLKAPVSDPKSTAISNEAPTSQANASPTQITEAKPAEEIDSLYSAEQPSEITDQAVEQLYLEPESQQTATRAETTADREPPAATSTRPNQRPPKTSEPETAQPPAMAQIRDLPWSLQQKIPSISYSSHHYDETGRSYVVINGEQKSAGQQLGNSLQLEEILADGVVLSFEGRRFKLPALSSWVNM